MNAEIYIEHKVTRNLVFHSHQHLTLLEGSTIEL